ncbi:hypothetical protein [Nostoc sp. TCL26-01]|uniref:hypothetical protein n=1 Tax=Nostoc sp. TCL26-01 TaxID=2576904 RepID=UPI0015C17888|nr:hypothetical protein [Nostoc sp. TCL26-01]QLE56674.1 hypothetical protein FD725_14880 [Nostoc sp. TCL26-01]
MKTLLLSAVLSLFVVDISSVKAAENSPNSQNFSRQNSPVVVAGLFDGIIKGVEDLNNTIRGVRSTIDQINRLQDDVNGKPPKPISPEFQPNNTPPTTEEINPQPNNNQPQTGNPENVITNPQTSPNQPTNPAGEVR